MRHNSSVTFLWLLSLLLAATGCQQDDMRLQGEHGGKGRIVLALSDIQVFTDDVVTRTTLDDYSGFVFTLNGTTVDGWTVRDSVITFTDNAAFIEAGTYSLSAQNLEASQTGSGCAYYSGATAEDFTLTVGGTTAVSISLGAPQNAKLTIAYSDAFAAKYQNVRMTLTRDERSVDLGSADGCQPAACFPAGSVSYVLSATAKSGSYVSDISAVAGSLTLAAGKHSTVTLTLNAVTGEIIPLVEGTHSGEFD